MVLLSLFLAASFAAVDRMGNVGEPGGAPAAPASGPTFADVNWETWTPMPTARFGMGVAGANSFLFAVGGYGTARVNLNEMYDPDADTWTTKSSMPTARNACYGATVSDKVYIVGGYDGSSRLNKVEEYDATADTWHVCPTMTYERTVPAAAGLKGKLYVAGGFTGTSYPATVERYDPVAGTWDTVAPMPTGRSGLAAAALNGKLYAMGGWTGSEPTHTEMEMYDPDGDTWTSLAPMPTGRMYLTAAALDGYILAIGGQLTFNGPQTDVVEVYDPVANEWSTTNPLPVARGSLGAATIGTNTHVIGGYSGGPLDENNRGQLQSGIVSLRRDDLRPFLSAAPNPFRSSVTIRFPAGTASPLRILDAAGRTIRTLAATAGSVSWNRTDDEGRPVKPGIYFCSARISGRDLTLKLATSH
jgi:hypothetical protein